MLNFVAVLSFLLLVVAVVVIVKSEMGIGIEEEGLQTTRLLGTALIVS